MRGPEPAIIYNLFPLLAGPLGRWEPHLQRARQMGFNWVFVNPIQRSGGSGSLYSVADYFDFDPRFVEKASAVPALEQARRMIEGAREMGLRMMVDLVINHCASDSELVRSHPEWFVWEQGGIAHPFCYENRKKVVWGDLAQFDHRHTADPEGLFELFVEIVDFLARLGFRGFRCDAAYQIPARLWKSLISETQRRYPDAVFFAETLGCSPKETMRTAAAGFDYVFNSSKWWDFRAPWLLQQYDFMRETAPSVAFPESHDTPRLFEELEGNAAGVKQRYLFSALFSTGVMMPIGFELGFRKALDVVRTTPADWEETGIDLRPFIAAVNDIKTAHPVFQAESPTAILPADNPSILVLWKVSPTRLQEALFILNKDPVHAQRFHCSDLREMLLDGDRLLDVSPEHPDDVVSTPYERTLSPGQGIVLVTPAENAPERLG